MKRLFYCIVVVYFIAFAFVWVVHGGWINFDASVQWAQAMTGEYDDWHPFAHTFLMMKLPSILWKDYRVVILFQMVLFLFAARYLIASLEFCGVGRRWLSAIIIIVLLHPLAIFFILTMPKDSAFAICSMGVVSVLLRIVFSRGECLENRVEPIVLGACLAGVYLIRHNGIFFAVPTVALLCFLYGRVYWKSAVNVLLLLTLIVFSFKVLLPRAFDVKPPSAHAKQYLFIEAAGMPLTMMGAVYVAHPDNIPEDAKKILESIRPRDVWLERYEMGSFNVVKHVGVGKLSEETIGGIYFPGWLNFAKAFWGTVTVDIGHAFRAWCALTGQVWNPFEVDVAKLQFPIVKTGLWEYRKFLIPILTVAYIPFLGVVPLSVIAFIVCLIWASVRRRWGGVLLSVPILVYDFCTMMLLSGHNMQRLFFCNVLLALPIIWGILHNEQYK